MSLSEAQKDGLACVGCNTDFSASDVPSVPVGRSETGSQMFACITCVDDLKNSPEYVDRNGWIHRER